MSLPPHLFATAFKAQRLGVVLALIVGIMVYLGSLSLAAQVFLGGGVASWGQQIEGRVTLEIPVAPEDSLEIQNAKVTQIADVMRAIPAVREVVIVPRAETARLLKPWIQDPLLLAALPLPALVDIIAQDGMRLEETVLRQRLASLGLGVEGGVGRGGSGEATEAIKITSHAAWMTRVMDLVRSLSLLAGVMFVLTGIALIVAISLVCRVAFSAQHGTIDLLHVMGATDKDIAAHFRRKVAHLSWPAALGGFLLAVATMAGLWFLFQRFWGMPLAFPAGGVLLLALVGGVACFGVLAATITAHLSVLRLLRRGN